MTSKITYHGVNIEVEGASLHFGDIHFNEDGSLALTLNDGKGRILLTVAKSKEPSQPRQTSISASVIEVQDSSPDVDEQKKRSRPEDTEEPVGSPQSFLPQIEPQVGRASPPTKIVKAEPNPKAFEANSGSKDTPPEGTPEARWGHTMTRIDRGRFILYGGQSEEDDSGEDETLGNLFVFDVEGEKWEEPVNCESVPRAWHSSTYLPSKNLLVAFGGERASLKGGMAVLDDLMVLDTEIFLWYPPAVSGTAPSARAGHTACLLHPVHPGHSAATEAESEGGGEAREGGAGKSLLAVFGGTRGRKWENSLYILDCELWAWSRPKVSGLPPSPRSYHSALASSPSTMCVFGGNDGDRCFNDVHLLYASTKGEGGKGGGGAPAWAWSSPLLVGVPPAPRTGHGACLLEHAGLAARGAFTGAGAEWGPKLLIQGGWDPCGDEAGDDGENGEVAVFPDAFELDCRTFEWSPVPGCLGEGLGDARTGHSLALAPAKDTAQGARGTVVLFGGQRESGERCRSVAVIPV